MDILRFITAGNVDDGKSTLIGRLLYDSKSILSDQLEAIKNIKRNNGNGDIDLALFTDGLRAEREQGITIDVAYKYFATAKRKFIIADTPGHYQYTRNMVTGASNSDLSIILIDARNGVTEQTRRHSLISSLLGIPYLTVCINKMDLVNYSETVFQNIVKEYRHFASKLDVKEVYFIPISALTGENVVENSINMTWYGGKNLLSYLEDIPIQEIYDLNYSRFPVQYIIRPQTDDLHDYRGYAGKIISGIFRKGDEITSYPSGLSSTISAIEIFGREISEAHAPMSVIIHLKDDLDISRGDVLVLNDKPPIISREFEAVICWMDFKQLKVGNKYILQHNSRQVKCAVKQVEYKIDINSFEYLKTDAIELNDICRIKIKTANPLIFDEYKQNKANGGIILIDENSNNTAAAGMIEKSDEA